MASHKIRYSLDVGVQTGPWESAATLAWDPHKELISPLLVHQKFNEKQERECLSRRRRCGYLQSPSGALAARMWPHSNELGMFSSRQGSPCGETGND